MKLNLQLFGGRGSSGGNSKASAVKNAEAKPKKAEGAVKSSTKSSSVTDKMTEPALYKSTTAFTKIEGALGKQVQLRLDISNNGNRGFKASVTKAGGNGEGFEATASTFAQAKKEIPRLIEKYYNNLHRFKNRKLSKSELRDIMNGM